MTVPDTLCILHDSNLPELPWFHLNLKKNKGTQSPIANELADDIFTKLSQLSKKEGAKTLALIRNHNRQSRPSG